MAILEMEKALPLEKAVSDVARTISRNLRLTIADQQIKLIDLAKITGVTSTTISRIKKDNKGELNISIETLAKLACGLGIQVSDLVK